MGNINEKMLQMVVDMAANGGRMEAHKWQGGIGKDVVRQ